MGKKKIAKHIVDHKITDEVIRVEKTINPLTAGIIAFIITTGAVLVISQLVKVNLRMNNGKTKTNRPQPVEIKTKAEDILKTDQLYIDPVILKTLIDKNNSNYLLIDIRSKAEFKNSHIKGAINIPSYQDYKEVYDSQININELIKQIKKENIRWKTIIIYSYTPNSQIAQNLQNLLIRNNLRTKILNISWNEWKNNFYNWLPGADMAGFNIDKYIKEKPDNVPVNNQPPVIPIVAPN